MSRASVSLTLEEVVGGVWVPDLLQCPFGSRRGRWSAETVCLTCAPTHFAAALRPNAKVNSTLPVTGKQ